MVDSDELCTRRRGRVGPCFVVFVKEIRGSTAEENSCLLKSQMGLGGPGIELVCTKGADKAVNGG